MYKIRFDTFEFVRIGVLICTGKRLQSSTTADKSFFIIFPDASEDVNVIVKCLCAKTIAALGE